MTLRQKTDGQHPIRLPPFSVRGKSSASKMLKTERGLFSFNARL